VMMELMDLFSWHHLLCIIPSLISKDFQAMACLSLQDIKRYFEFWLTLTLHLKNVIGFYKYTTMLISIHPFSM
jgi:hypothetical protein